MSQTVTQRAVRTRVMFRAARCPEGLCRPLPFLPSPGAFLLELRGDLCSRSSRHAGSVREGGVQGCGHPFHTDVAGVGGIKG